MAKVLISVFSNVTFTKEKYHDSFVQNFINVLERMGNDVMSIFGNDYTDHPFKFKTINYILKQELLEKVNKFNPDIIITFNNYFPCEEIITKTDCPIILYTADGCDFFAFQDLIKKYNDRYIYLNLNESIYSNLREYYKFIKDSQFCDFGYATDFRRQNIDQDINISFLGSIPNVCFGNLHDYFMSVKSLPYKDAFFDALERFKKNTYGKFDMVLDNFQTNIPIETLAIWLITTKDRFMTLSNLTDLGLDIYGWKPSFVYAGMQNYELFKLYNPDICVTQEQSEFLYNRSKVSLNLPNARAQVGFSWRVPDILASQSVLLCNKRKDLDRLLKGYTKIPQYESPLEARDIAQKLLKDDVWRKDISIACNQMIEDKCRFEDKIRNIQVHTGICLESDKKGSHIFLTNKFKVNSDTNINKKKKKRKRDKILHEATKMLPYFIAKKLL